MVGRQVGDLPVYGVAIPTVDGIRNVLHLVGASKSGGRHVVWHNMREEPVRGHKPSRKGRMR